MKKENLLLIFYNPTYNLMICCAFALFFLTNSSNAQTFAEQNTAATSPFIFFLKTLLMVKI